MIRPEAPSTNAPAWADYTKHSTHLFRYSNQGRQLGRCAIVGNKNEYRIWIYSLEIRKEYRGKGYGKKMIKDVIKYIRENYPKCNEVKLHAANPTAAHVYETVGFVHEGNGFMLLTLRSS